MVRLLEYFLGVLDIPVGIDSLVPRQAENLSQVVGFSACFDFVLGVETVYLFLENFSNAFWHVLHCIELLLVFSFLRLFIVL